MIKPSLFYIVFTGLLATNIFTLVALMMSGDIASLIRGRNDVIHTAYQDRIVQLRLEVDRLHSRQYAHTGNINLQLQELAHQQEVLSEQHSYVKALAAKAQELGIDTASVPYVANNSEALITGSIGDETQIPVSDLEHVTRSIGRMMTESRLALTALSEAAILSTDTIVEQLDHIGIQPSLPQPPQPAVGGPFQPVPGDAEPVSLVDDANAVVAAFERFRVARQIATQSPIYAPLVGKTRVSSNYGKRKDPFLNRTAFHSGIDFAATSGTQVVSAGVGKISFVGRKSGYGKVVEVEHMNGLITRYAHLSAYLVDLGENVNAGTPIARVGSTGRSTGPHLHFEVRKGDGPLNPARFLKVGKRLAKFL